MNLDEKQGFSLESSEDDFLIRKIVLAHDPDGRYLDSELLLQAVENVMCSAPTADVGIPLFVHFKIKLMLQDLYTF